MNQLELFRWNPPGWFLAMLGRLMVLANAGRYDGKQYFYWAKTEILRRYGTKLRDDVQRIRHLCHTCDGTGWWHYWAYNYDTCDHCLGTGTWEYLFVRLGVYELGGRTFHVPIERETESRYSKREYSIKGKIKHPEVDKRAAWWSALVLITLSRPHLLRGFLFERTDYYSFRNRWEQRWWSVMGPVWNWWIDQTDLFHRLDIAPWDAERQKAIGEDDADRALQAEFQRVLANHDNDYEFEDDSESNFHVQPVGDVGHARMEDDRDAAA